MTKDAFWRIIDKARASAEDCDETAAGVTERLRTLPPSEILAFSNHIAECLDISYRHDLWAVAYIANGGCSDDGFEYFRGWLIAQGREYFEAAMEEPERAAERITPGEDHNECEDILYTASHLYHQITGQAVPQRGLNGPREPAGIQWEEDDIERLYPALCERFFA